jgi:hypothetical protein
VRTGVSIGSWWVRADGMPWRRSLVTAVVTMASGPHKRAACRSQGPRFPHPRVTREEKGADGDRRIRRPRPRPWPNSYAPARSPGPTAARASSRTPARRRPAERPGARGGRAGAPRDREGRGSRRTDPTRGHSNESQMWGHSVFGQRSNRRRRDPRTIHGARWTLQLAEATRALLSSVTPPDADEAIGGGAVAAGSGPSPPGGNRRNAGVMGRQSQPVQPVVGSPETSRPSPPRSGPSSRCAA